MYKITMPAVIFKWHTDGRDVLFWSWTGKQNNCINMSQGLKGQHVIICPWTLLLQTTKCINAVTDLIFKIWFLEYICCPFLLNEKGIQMMKCQQISLYSAKQSCSCTIISHTMNEEQVAIWLMHVLTSIWQNKWINKDQLTTLYWS